MVCDDYFHTPVSHLHDPAYFAGVLGNGQRATFTIFQETKY